jgi:8-amino-7-oxononanoate synthase
LHILADEPWRPKAVLAHARTLAEICGVSGAPESAVVSVILGHPEAAVTATSDCLAAGLRVGCFRPPAVAAGTSRLRLTARASLTDEEIDLARTVLTAVLGTGGR